MKRLLAFWVRSPSLCIAAVTLVIAIGALGHVWVQLQVITLGYEISQQSELRHQLSEMQAQLKLELETRKDLAKIDRIARDELHMAPPDPRAIRVITLGDKAQ